MRLPLAPIALLLVGCSSSEVPPSVFGPTRNFGVEDTGPTRICGVVAGSPCEGNGELARCLCGPFEEQVGRFVCCRDGVATAGQCASAKTIFDCSGMRAAGAPDAAPGD